MTEEEFTLTSGVKFMHHLPRFGHGSDFSKLVSSIQSEQVDYIMGLWAVSFFIFAVFVMWGSIIVALGCMGKKRVGLLAGRIRVTSDEKGDFYTPRHLCKLRCFFILLACSIIFLNTFMIGPGLTSIKNATFSMRKLTRDVDELATQGLLIMDDVSNARRNIGKLDIVSVLQVENACPNLSNNALLNDEKLTSSLKTIGKAFDSLEDYVDGDNFEEIRSSIDVIMEGTEQVGILVTNVELNCWILKMFALALDVLVFFMIIATLISLGGNYFEPLKFIIMLLVFPLFVFIISASWVAAAFVSFIPISNADFCSGDTVRSGPDGTVKSVLRAVVSSQSIVYKTFVYFQSECTTRDPIEGFYKYEEFIQTGIGAANTFMSHIDDVGTDKISSQCGTSVTPIIEGIGIVKDNLGVLLNALRSSFELASCSKMRPIYEQAFEETACSKSGEGLAMMFLLLITIGVIGMVMIMFRAAMYPCKLVYSPVNMLPEDEDEWEEYQAYLQYMSDFLNFWGSNEDSEFKSPSIKNINEVSTSESSFSPESLLDPHSLRVDVHTPPPSSNPLYNSHCSSPQAAEDHFDKENVPLSPHKRSFACPTFADFDENIDDNQLRSSHLSMIKPSSRRGGHRTQDFFSPGVFSRRRKLDNDLESDVDDVPDSPLMSSPKEYGRSYFPQALNISRFISPLAKRVLSPRDDDSSKNKHF